MKKNDMIEITIDSLTNGGQGIGRLRDSGLAVFVKDTVPGDRVRARIIKAKSSYAIARPEEILSPSKERIPVRCPVARACGGCQLQMMRYEAQLSYKRQIVRDCLERIGGFAPDQLHIEPVIGMKNPWHYRNKAQYPIGTDRNQKPVAGFYAGRTHSIVPALACEIGCPSDRFILETILDWMNNNHISSYDEKTGAGLVRHVYIRTGFASGEILVVLAVNADSVPAEKQLVNALTGLAFEPGLLRNPDGDEVAPRVAGIILNVNREMTNVILGRESRVLWGKDYIEDTIDDIRYHVSWRSFFQVNPFATRTLYRKALEFASLTGEENVWDLYCGTGTISLFLARKAKHVYGVEIVPEAIADARRNADLNSIENTSFFVGKAEEVLPDKFLKDGIPADVVVVDPPRKGCDIAVLETILAVKPSRVVYVSCDPGTLARDLRVLCDGGYSLEGVQPVDMFGQTYHVESCVLLERVSNRKADSYVKLNVKMEDYYKFKDAKVEQ